MNKLFDELVDENKDDKRVKYRCKDCSKKLEGPNKHLIDICYNCSLKRNGGLQPQRYISGTTVKKDKPKEE